MLKPEKFDDETSEPSVISGWQIRANMCRAISTILQQKQNLFF